MSVYTKSIQEKNNVTVENHQTAVLCKMLFCKCRNMMKDNGLMTSQ